MTTHRARVSELDSIGVPSAAAPRSVDRRGAVGEEEIDLVPLETGISLRVLRWDAPRADSAAAATSFLLVHGLASNARLWDGVAPRLALAGHPTVAVDLRGHGRSDKPDEGYDFATISEDLRSLIGKLGFDRPVLAGQSWGASVVLDFAVRHPELTSGLILVDGGLANLADGFPSWEACWERLAPPQLVGLPISDVEGYFHMNHTDWPEEGLEGSLANFEVRSDGTIAPWLTRERHKAILRAMWEQRTSDLWSALRVPALIVPVDGGDNEWTRSKRGGAEAASRALEESGTPGRVLWFKGDHDIHAQRPAELAAAILETVDERFFAGGAPKS